MRRNSPAALVIFTLLISALAAAPLQSRQKDGPDFSVADSVEMARFQRGDGKPKFSPDRRWFGVVTTRGILRSNHLVSTLWLFRSAAVEKLLQAGGRDLQYRPKPAVILSETPRRSYSDSYEPLITGIEWSRDSQSLVFLAQKPEGNLQIREFNVRSGVNRALTPSALDVVQFRLTRTGIVYLARRMSPIFAASASYEGASRVVTGLSLVSILFENQHSSEGPLELWTSRNGRNHKIIDPDTHRPISLSPLPPPPYSVLSVSPDDKSAVVLVPSRTIPAAWEAYKPAFAYLRLHSKVSHGIGEPWPAQYALVDLRTGKTTELISAPNAWALGSADVNEAAWSSDGEKLLLTNTYLPLRGAGEPTQAKSLHYCVAAVVEVASKSRSCVLFADYPRAAKRLLSASFGKDHQIILRFWTASSGNVQEHFPYEPRRRGSTRTRRITELTAVSRGTIPTEGLVISIKQDLNTRPTLWATDHDSGKSRMIWDPNPQLANVRLGQASEFRWKDDTGYEWVGGLIKPPGYIEGRRYPLVIQTHGFQPDEFLTDGAYTTAFAAQALASAGMIVLQMPVRHDHLVTAQEAPDQIRGFKSAIDRLVDEGLVLRDKVGIIGFSRTCYHVESALIQDPGMFAAATLADGVDESYMQDLLFTPNRSTSEAEQIYQRPAFGPGLRRWLKLAPGFNLDRIETPIRIEAISPPGILEEWEIYASLWKQSKPVDLLYFPDGQHVLQKPLERLASEQGNVDWFRFWLEGQEDRDSRTAQEYRRWRKLRSEELQLRSR